MLARGASLFFGEIGFIDRGDDCPVVADRSADLLLHPVRLRILQAFLGDRALTTAALRSELPDVSPASLYRHIARLVNGGVLSVAAERRIRGAVERTYVLRVAAASVNLDELGKMSREDHRQAFIVFVAGLLAEFDRYLSREDIDLLRDGVGYRMAGIWLDDLELTEFLRDLARVIEPVSRTHRSPADGAGSSAADCSQARTPQSRQRRAAEEGPDQLLVWGPLGTQACNVAPRWIPATRTPVAESKHASVSCERGAHGSRRSGRCSRSPWLLLPWCSPPRGVDQLRIR